MSLPFFRYFGVFAALSIWAATAHAVVPMMPPAPPSVPSTPEESSGCGTELTEATASKSYCARYEIMNQWYPGLYKQSPITAADYNGCVEFAKATVRLRNSVCMYYKELSLFGEKAAAAHVSTGGQASKVADAAALNSAEQAIHKKYYKLLSKNRYEQFDHFTRYTQALTDARAEYERKLMAESLRCVGDGSQIPSPYLLTVGHDTQLDDKRILDRFQELGKKAEDIAKNYSTGFGTVTAKVKGLGNTMSTITGGAGTMSTSTVIDTTITGSAPSMVEEHIWGLATGEIADLQKMMWNVAVERWGEQFAGPILDIGTAITADYLRNGKIDTVTIVNAICGAISLTAGIVCTTVGAGLQWMQFRANAYSTFTYYYLKQVKTNPTSAELAGAFCAKLAEIKKDVEEKEKALTEELHAKYISRAQFCGAMNNEMMSAREGIRKAPDEAGRQTQLAAYKQKYAQYINQPCMAQPK